MNDHRHKDPFWDGAQQALTAIALITFLLYSVLLMREFTTGNQSQKSLMFALNDIFTGKSFAVALIAASVAYFGHKYFQTKS